MKNMKMKTIIMVTVSIVVAIGLGLLFFLANRNMTSSMRDSASSIMDTYLQAQAETVASFVSNGEMSLALFSDAPAVRDALANPNDAAAMKKAQDYTVAYHKTLGGWEGIYTSDWDTKVLTHSNEGAVGIVMREGDRLTSLQNALLATDGVYDVGILTSPASGQQVLSLYRRIDVDGKTVGLVGGGFISAKLKESLDAIQVSGMDNAKFYMVNTADSKYIFNADEAENGLTGGDVVEDSMLLQVIESVNGGSAGGEIDYQNEAGDAQIARYVSLPDMGWAIVLSDSEDEIYAAATSSRNVLLIVCLITFVLIVGLTFVVVNVSTAPLRVAEHAIMKLGQLNLAKSATLEPYVGKSNEIGHIATEVENLRQILTGITQTLNGCSGSLTAASETMRSGAGNLLEYVTDNAATTEELAASINTTNTTIADIGGRIEKVNQIVADIEAIVKEGRGRSQELLASANSMADNSSKALASSQRNIEKNRENVSVAVEKLKTLTRINDLASEILKITNQTNLLSLNASIEAARAGEAGRGFAVVADEIGTLAKNSTETVSKIQEICAETNSNINSVNHCFDDIIGFLEAEVAGQFESFAGIAKQNSEAASNLQGIIDEIRSIADEFATFVADLAAEMDSLRQASEQNEMAVDDIVQKNMQTNSIAEDLSGVVEDNRGSADQLTDIVGKFRNE